ncbi:hypothetical protein EKA98_09480 [Streptococcus pseudopneumoniae]|nr:hypothetical protein [Streptococcus pseudopneumoniae]TMR81038.1 hypothetical protein E3V52_00320 [Streptococcus pseudopneumoniae]
MKQTSQILCIACFIALFQLDGSNALLVILISDYGLLLEKTIILFENLFKPRQRRLAVLKYSLRLIS